jgi:hypothetical protein
LKLGDGAMVNILPPDQQAERCHLSDFSKAVGGACAFGPRKPESFGFPIPAKNFFDRKWNPEPQKPREKRTSLRAFFQARFLSISAALISLGNSRAKSLFQIWKAVGKMRRPHHPFTRSPLHSHQGVPHDSQGPYQALPIFVFFEKDTDH